MPSVWVEVENGSDAANARAVDQSVHDPEAIGDLGEEPRDVVAVSDVGFHCKGPPAVVELLQHLVDTLFSHPGGHDVRAFREEPAHAGSTNPACQPRSRRWSYR